MKKTKKKNIQDSEIEDTTYDLIPKSIIYEDPELTTRIEYEDPKQTEMQKFNNRFKKGSMINSITLLFSFSPILMFLFMPYAIIHTGYILFILILLYCSLLSGYTTHLLLKIKAENQVSSFHQLLSQLIGRRVCFFYHSLHIAYMLGTSIMYLIMSKSLFLIIFRSEEYLYNIIFHLGGLLCFQLPCLFIHSNDKLRTVEFVFMVGTLFTGLICSIDAIIYLCTNKADHNYIQNVFAHINYGYGMAIAILTLAFSNQMQFYPEIRQLKLFTPKRGDFLITRTVLIQVLWTLTTGILCFFNFTDNNTPLILFEYTLSLETRSTLMMYVYYCLLFFIISFAQFKIGNTVVKIIDEALETRSISQSNINKGVGYNVCSILIFLLLNVLVYFVNNRLNIHKALVGVIGILGGIVSSVLCLILPIYCYNHLFYGLISSSKKCFHIALILITFGFGLIATISSIFLIF